jgi:ankyrin repeat protein
MLGALLTRVRRTLGRVRPGDMFDGQAVALAAAVAADDARRVAALVKQGADPNARGHRGLTLLQFAVFKHARHGVAALIAAGADPTRADDSGATAIHDAAAVVWPDVLPVLLDTGADPNVRNTVTGVVPLASAVLAHRRSQLRQLLADGADPNLADRMGNTPLLVAAEVNAMDDILALLDAGADPNHVNVRGDGLVKILDVTPARMLLPATAAARARVDDWLRRHGELSV